MALTAAQKVEIKRHLGYHAAAQSRFPLVEGFSAVEDVISTLPAETEAAVVAILAKLSGLEAKIAEAPKRLKAVRVGSIQLPGGAELDELWREVGRWRRELATLIGIPYRRGGGGMVV